MRIRSFLVLLLCLLAFGCGKEKSTEDLIEELKSSNDRDRTIAVRTLPRRKGDAAKVIPALIDALKSRDNGLRLSAAIGLGSYGEQAKDAIPALQTALNDRDRRVREAAVTALSRIDPQQFPPGSKSRGAPGK